MDISRIKVDGQIYEIKDTYLRDTLDILLGIKEPLTNEEESETVK